MFCYVIPGRPVCSEFQQLDNNHAIFSIQDIASVNHITVFITQPFPSGYAATVHFLWPGSNSKWQVLGLITNDKPSALFKLNGNKAIDDQESRARMWDSAASGINQCAQLGICVEPIELAEHEVAQAKAGNENARLLGSNMSLTEDTNPELKKVRVIVEKILNHLQNYIMSFVKVDPSGTEVIPANAFQQWIQAIQRKVQDQSFLDTQ